MLPHNSATRKKILNSRATVWELADSVLYKMCRKYPGHAHTNEIIAKALIIGRTYAVALERNKSTQDREANERYYTTTIAGAVRKANLDRRLALLRQLRPLSETAIFEALRVHGALMDELRQVTEDDKRSFASKYLHFHLPKHFFIYDSRAVKSMRAYCSRLPPASYAAIQEHEGIDREYATYCLKAVELRKAIREGFGVTLNPRQLDNFLIK